MKALVLGSDTPIGLTIIRELGAHGVEVEAIGRSGRSIGGASRFATKEHVRPQGAIDQWVPQLIRQSGADALLAVSESDLLELSALPRLIENCHILTPRPGPLAQVLDKSVTLALGRSLKMDVPISWQPVQGEDFAARTQSFDYPVILKWADPPRLAPMLAERGLTFLKAEYANDESALLAALSRYDGLARWPLVQTYCPGVGIGQMIHMSGGQATLRFQHLRLHEWPPEGGVSTLCRSVPITEHSAQMIQSEALLRAFDWDGPAMVEYRHDPATGRYWLMEVNGRFWGSLPLASASGAEFAWESFRRSVLRETATAPVPRTDLRARYMIPESRRLVRVVFQEQAIRDSSFRRRPWAETLDYFLEFFNFRTRYYVFRFDDPRPLICDFANIVRKLWSREQG
ncbi:carboxylate--amine ligase [Sphingomonas sp.]|uniref:carboxylate--amine ligase n=1 Tax=Sphingomonas sp. TaxID=28214 RepID=UPI0025F385DD|nr:carboxylate--amine ligase [Sphingomonas sp.]